MQIYTIIEVGILLLLDNEISIPTVSEQLVTVCPQYFHYHSPF